MSLPFFLALLILCGGYALIRGGAPERASAGMQIGAFILGMPLHFMLAPIDYRSAIVGGALIDAALLVGLIALAWRSTRFWPLWVAGWQLAAIIAHLAKVLDPSMLRAGYAIQAQLWAYPMLIATAVGTWRHRQRRRSGDPDPPWKSMIA